MRTANRMPARPTRCSRPPVAPYRQALPAMASPAGLGREVRLRPDHDAATGQALAHVVVGLADERQVHVLVGEGAEGLAGRAAQLQADRAAQLAALQGAGQAGPNERSAVVRRRPGARRPAPGRGTRPRRGPRAGRQARARRPGRQGRDRHAGPASALHDGAPRTGASRRGRAAIGRSGAAALADDLRRRPRPERDSSERTSSATAGKYRDHPRACP